MMMQNKINWMLVKDYVEVAIAFACFIGSLMLIIWNR